MVLIPADFLQDRRKKFQSLLIIEGIFYFGGEK